MPTTQTLYARQPIFDTQMNIVAYELLFRGDWSQANGETATADVLLGAFDQSVFNPEHLNVPVFINFPTQILFDTPPFDPTKLVIEVLEDVTVTDGLVQRLAQLREEGYKVALDDYELTDHTEPLLQAADIVKLDLLGPQPIGLEEVVRKVSERQMKLLAEKVEDQATYKICQELGFDYYQGYFFSKPELVTGTAVVSPGVTTVLKLISALQEEGMTATRLESIVLQDPAITYRVLKLVNSVAYRRGDEITTVANAITMLGFRKLTAFVSLFLLADVEDKPRELTRYTALRGKLLECFGRSIACDYSDESLFTLGVLSCCDAYFDIPLQQLVEELPLVEEMKEALLQRAGPLGWLLDTAQQYQEGAWQNVNWHKQDMPELANQKILDDAYLQAQEWALQHEDVL